MFINRNDFEHYIKNFQFKQLFNELGWEHVRKEHQVSVDDRLFRLEAVAEKRDFVIFICEPQDGQRFLDKSHRRKIDQVIAKLFFEHLIIFIDNKRTKQIWQLCIREPNRPIIVRETEYHVHQTPENLFQRLKGCFFSIEEEGKIGLVDVKQRVSESFNENAEKVTKKFYERFKTEHKAFLEFIKGIDNSVDKDWYGSLMLNRLMFIYFIQKKGFLDNNLNYLRDKLRDTQTKKGRDKFYSFYRNFLLVLFHDGLGRPDHNEELIKEIGRVPYLNGGLFDVHQIEKSYKDLNIEDEAFERVFEFFDQYEWHLDTRIAATGRDINPDVIGYIFEKYINDRAAMGAYYTKEDITDYISKNTIIPFLFDEVKKECPNAFQGDNSLWKILQGNTDKYIYEAVRKGTELELPEEIAKGIDNVSERSEWNKNAFGDYALPTEIWREVVERRNRYYEIKKKIQNGEIKEINDFITYNLDIKQFVQDVVAQYEDSKFIHAFYKAITKITVLDPTCGSGAFLFAALNILEPLYEECIDRMKIFVEDVDQSKFPQFRQVLIGIQNHPNQKYYIYKSIILNNLYGVDIMNEAAEIAKLRLFLKLVATVEVDYSKDNLGLEPLPDIDFNIRAGNTLVGFASLEDVKRSMCNDWVKLQALPAIEEKAQDIDRLVQLFRQQQTELGGEVMPADKQNLRDRLSELEEELNHYLVGEYGIDFNKKAAYKKWLDSHRLFHWFIEFYNLMKIGGFNVIIGNPPYVEYSKVKNDYLVKRYKTESAGNLYAYVLERCFSILSLSGRLGMIVQLPIVCTDRMKPLQIECMNNNELIWFSNFDDRPGKLFDGLQHIRASIVITKKDKFETHSVFSTNYNRWHSNNRVVLFDILSYSNVKKHLIDGAIPKIGQRLAKEIKNRLKNFSPLKQYLRNYSQYIVYFHNSPQYWIRAMTFIPYFWNERYGEQISTQVKSLYMSNKSNASVITALLNSSLFYWWFVILSDCRHLNMREIEFFPIDLDQISEELKFKLSELTEQLMLDYKKNAIRKETKYQTTGKVVYDEFYPRYSKPIIDQIDQVLAKHYGFTDEELDFIINYDIKYRMGKELN